MQCSELRLAFLSYFQSQGHHLVASSSLVPHNDATLLFTNAGMVQFKENFLGQVHSDYTRATTVQRCVRAGGKHNDLDNVGYTARHHTFFEMLGNFSFGDYFKREAIQFAWQFLTKILQLPAEKLWITVHHEDDEAARIWLQEIKINPERLTRCGDKDNFWAMGDTGPCGPCSEIFYDHGESVAGGPPGTPEADGDRYMEIWNLVFMQYERNADGQLIPLPKPSVDTGMGLERLATVLQGVKDNYHIDLFVRLRAAVAKVTHSANDDQPSVRVIADHIRSSAFLMADGVLPSNEGRGYVLRRIIRRACRHGHKLGMHEMFFHKLVAPLVAEMGQAYPELARSQALIETLLLEEEQQFARTLSVGMQLFEQDVAALQPGATIAGQTVFKLYDTYGFPLDLTADMARERGLEVDIAGFEQYMAKQRSQSQQASRFVGQGRIEVEDTVHSSFCGYQQLVHLSEVVVLAKDNKRVERMPVGTHGVVVLAQTPFYAEAGGQVGDQGQLLADGVCFEVHTTQKQGDLILHHGVVQQGELSVGMTLSAEVNMTLRQQTALNHSATHLLHAALQQQLGAQVQQKGSLVTPERLRFDFSYARALTAAQLLELEILINAQIRANYPVQTQVMAAEAALKSGAQALFGEKYGDEVRVLSMGDFSKELCGGTHVRATGEIGICKIVSESAVAAGIRRIEAVTGSQALTLWQQTEEQVQQLAAQLKTDKTQVHEKLEQLIQKQKQQEQTMRVMQSKLARSQVDQWLEQVQVINGVKLLICRLADADAKGLREMADTMRSKLGDAVILLVATDGEKATLVASSSSAHQQQLPAGELVRVVAEKMGGKGGGRADMAQGGGTQIELLDQALALVPTWISERSKG